MAQRPKQNISGARHPNLAAAQRLSQQAWDKIVAAQENKFLPRSDRQRLDDLTARLRGRGRTSALFDMTSYAKRFEDAVLRIAGDRGAGVCHPVSK